jgi:hypothetical protein
MLETVVGAVLEAVVGAVPDAVVDSVMQGWTTQPP